MPTVSRQPTLAGFDELAADEMAELAGEPAAEAASVPARECGSAESPDLTGKTVYVVDSHSLIYQVFHALPEMSGPSGQPVARCRDLCATCST